MSISTATPAALAQPQPISGQQPANQADWAQFASTLNLWLQFLAPTTGTFTATMTGGLTSPSVTVEWVKTGKLLTAYVPACTVTSNSIACTLGVVPTALIPVNAQTMAVPALINNGAAGIGGLEIDSFGVLALFVNLTSTGFASTGTKGISSAVCVSWLLS